MGDIYSAGSAQSAPLILNFNGPIHALVMGASGGIGIEMVRLMARHPHTAKLFAVARFATGNPALQEIAVRHAGRIVLIDADITDETQLAAMTASIVADVPSLHLVVNAAGMLHTPTRGPEKTLAQLTLAGLQQSFAVNAFGPILLAKALMPLWRHADPVVFASLSARVGSINDNRLGGWYSYRAAKAAQNQLLKTLSIELTRMNRRSTVLALHPGTTDTALSKPFQANVRDDALFAPMFAAQCLLDVIAQRGPGETGGFYAWDGKPIDW